VATDDEVDDLVASFDVPMAVVTVAVDGERSGCLVGFHSQCSIEPRRYAVWLSRANHTFPLALRADHFAVHLLAESDRDLAVLFGTQTGDEVDKFAQCDWVSGPDGVPLLTGCSQRLVMRRTGLLDGDSDHVCLVGDPVEVTGPAPFRPLLLSAVDHLTPGHESDERQR
jgi:flavin reductase (DIM6/NTAB) family NADH-FMN oxidoreductase RutF